MFHLFSTGDQRAELRIIRYDADIRAMPGGLVMAHFAVVHPKGKPDDHCREVMFSIPTALQDEYTAVLGNWEVAIGQLRDSYPYPVDLDIRVPMDIWRRAQAKLPKFIKDWVSEDSVPHNYSMSIPLIGGN